MSFRATYRLQLTPEFDFAAARRRIPYLRDLGISHLYLSPSLQARPGSTHGYDVIDPTAISADLGGEAGFRALETPVLVMVGDEDDHCLQPGLFLKRTIKRAALAVFPKSGHTLNLEEPELFNRMVSDFIAQVEAGRWTPRDPRANPAQVMRTD